MDNLRLGNDHAWYYRGIRRDGETPQIRYFRAVDLETPGVAVQVGAYRNAASPENADAAPALLSGLFVVQGGGTAAVISADFAAVRYFAAANGAGAQDPDSAAGIAIGYYRRPGPEKEGLALLVRPDGGGLIRTAAADVSAADAAAGVNAAAGMNAAAVEDAAAGADLAAPRELSLPSLPEGFVYTWVGLAGDTLFAAWEEQQEWNIGAAGFMALKL
jgi:hypothetical protein